MAKGKKSTEELKHYLLGARYWRDKADVLSDEIERLRSECEKMTSTFSNTPPSMDGYTDHRQQKYDDMIDKQRKYAENVRKCNKRIQEIQLFIENLYNYKEREVCELFYIYMYDWDAVALKMSYTRRWTEKVHGRALLHLLEIHKSMVEDGEKPLF